MNFYPMFNAEQWKIVPADKVEDYGNLTNVVSVFYFDEEKCRYQVAVVPPTHLFKFMKDVIHVYKEDKGHFYLEETQMYWVFGIMLDSGKYVDLWNYKALPVWAESDKSLGG